MTPLTGMLIGIAIGCIGALAGVWIAGTLILSAAERIDDAAAKEMTQ